MNALQQWMEKHLVPVAAKIGSQKHLVALRDSFVGMLPATMVGAMATLVSVMIGTVPSAVQQLVQRSASNDGTFLDGCLCLWRVSNRCFELFERTWDSTNL